MEEQEGKTWKGTASDLYNRLKEIIGEATGAEQTDEQPRLDIAALRDRDHPTCRPNKRLRSAMRWAPYRRRLWGR